MRSIKQAIPAAIILLVLSACGAATAPEYDASDPLRGGSLEEGQDQADDEFGQRGERKVEP